MKRLLALALLLAASPAAAGELGLAWDFVNHPPPPYVYTVFRDGVEWPGVTALLDPNPATPGRSSLLITGLPFPGDCVPRTYQLAASNSAGMSGLSNPQSSIPRPGGPSGTPSIQVLLNTGGVHQIQGDYFPPDIQVATNGVPVTVGVNRLNCQLVEIPTTPGLPVSVCVINPSLPDSPNCWSQPPPLAPINVGFN